jgi:Na+-translocating ferredoxin:NAD+ oxidoreductase subunit A
MNDMFLIFVSAAVVTNFVLVYFLGLCPVIGVTSRSATVLRLGLATTFVMVLASFAAWGLNFILVAAPFLRVIAFVVAIASIVQIVELFVKKTSPVLYRDLGIFLPLIASNSQVLGMTIFQTNRGYTLAQGLMFALGGGLGITAVLSLVGGIRERLELAPVPAVARGPAVVFLVVAMLSLVFMGFAGMGSA